MAEQYEDEIVLIRYHTWWPSENDPFYRFNIPEMRARINYYETNYDSRLMIDGIIDGGSNQFAWDSLFNERMSVPSPMDLQITGVYDYESRNGNLVLYVTATDEITLDDLRFHCVVTESDIYWEAPNGLTIHNQTMRDMVPNVGGESFEIENGETITFERTFSLNEILAEDNCEIVIFAQSNETKEILQAAKITIPDLNQTGLSDEIPEIPARFSLSPAYPNPFNASTTIRYRISEESFVDISIYDVLGRKVETLIDANQQAGFHQVIWNAAERPSGTYFYKLRAGNYSETRKVSLLK